VPNPEDAWASDALDHKKQEEGYLLAKVLAQLSYIPGVRAAVTVDLDMSKKTTERTQYTRPQPLRERRRSFENNTRQRPGETGTNPNVGVALGGGGQASGSKEKEDETEYGETKPSEKTLSQQGPFVIRRTTAAIGVPRSWFVNVFKAQPGNEDTEPADGDPVFETIIKQQQERITDIVSSIVMAASEQDVRVAMYYDFDPGTSRLRDIPGGVVQAGIQPSGGVGMWVGRYGSEAGLGFLALFALMMLIRLVRKSTRAVHAIPTPRRAERGNVDLIAEADALMAAENAPVGQAGAPDGVLQGQEVDENTLRVKHLGEQVSRMVDESPQVAADLLKRWVEND
jgi:flagellar biosynthesis/type III secretory pathway M-ring protein FliF/YscJ